MLRGCGSSMGGELGCGGSRGQMQVRGRWGGGDEGFQKMMQMSQGVQTAVVYCPSNKTFQTP